MANKKIGPHDPITIGKVTTTLSELMKKTGGSREQVMIRVRDIRCGKRRLKTLFRPFTCCNRRISVLHLSDGDVSPDALSKRYGIPRNTLLARYRRMRDAGKKLSSDQLVAGYYSRRGEGAKSRLSDIKMPTPRKRPEDIKIGTWERREMLRKGHQPEENSDC